MTYLNRLIYITLMIGMFSVAYAEDTIIVTSTEDSAFGIQKMQEQLNKLQAHVYTVLPLEAQEAMPKDAQDPSKALENFDENKVKAKLSSKVDELRADLADLRGKMEEVHHVVKMQAAKIVSLEQQLASAAPQQPADAKSPGPNNAPDMLIAAIEPPVSPVLSAEDIVANEIKALDPQEAFEKSKNYIRQGNYDKAEIALKTFVDTFKDHVLLGSGYYYLGELYYIQEKFEAALSIFAQGYKSQPAGEKAPDILLKMAQCFHSLKQIDKACTTLTQLDKNFPRLEDHLQPLVQKLKTALKCPGSSKSK